MWMRIIYIDVSLEMTCNPVWTRCSYSMDEMFMGIYSLECMDEMKSSYVDKIVEICSIELDEM